MNEDVIKKFEQKLNELTGKIGAINSVDLQRSSSGNLDFEMSIMKFQILLSSFNVLEATAKGKYESALLRGNSQVANECGKYLNEIRIAHDEVFSYAKSLK